LSITPITQPGEFSLRQRRRGHDLAAAVESGESPFH
jgi:hypothetical protein